MTVKNVREKDADEQVFTSAISDRALDMLVANASSNSPDGFGEVMEAIRQSGDFSERELAIYDKATNIVFNKMMKDDLSISYYDLFRAIDAVIAKIVQRQRERAES